LAPVGSESRDGGLRCPAWLQAPGPIGASRRARRLRSSAAEPRDG
jgi:hypothetical protein